MRFVAQVRLDKSLFATFAYHNPMLGWEDRFYYDLIDSQSVWAHWEYQFLFFMDQDAPYLDGRTDAMMFDDYIHEDDETKEFWLSWPEYVKLVMGAIEGACNTHLDDNARIWSEQSEIIDKPTIQFDFDMPDGEKDKSLSYKQRNKLNNLLDPFEGRSDFKMFGSPISQQTPHRYFDVRGQRRRPWFGYNDPHHDFTWQIYCANKMNTCDRIGKVDGSCT